MLKTYAALVAPFDGGSHLRPGINRSPDDRNGSTDRETRDHRCVSTLAPLIAEIGKRFESLYPTVRH